jgi:hypothetical protein
MTPTLRRLLPGWLAPPLLLLVAAVPSARFSEAKAQGQNLRPNLVLIVTDDQGFGDMGRAGELDCDDPLSDPSNCQHPLETALQTAGLPGFTPTSTA